MNDTSDPFGRRLILAGCLLLSAAAARGGDGVGTTGAEILKVENGVRAAGMGGAYTGLARDVTGGLYWNPGGLGFMPRNETAASYNSSYAELKQGYAAYGHLFESAGGFAAGMTYLSAGRQVETQASPNGGYDVVGSFTPTSWVLSAGYGRAFFDDRLGLGMTVKEVDESWGGGGQDRQDPHDSDSAAALDMGLLLRAFDRRLSVGLSYQNLGTAMHGYDLPAALRVGLGLELGPCAAAFDVVAPKADGLGYRFGLEYVVMQVLAVHAGYDSTLNSVPGGSRGFTGGFSTGIGLRLAGLGLDYAFSPYGDLGNAHRMGVSYRWGGGAEPKRAARRWAASGGPEPAAAESAVNPLLAARAGIPPAPAPAPPAAAVAAPPPEPAAACPDEAAQAPAAEDETEQRFLRAERFIAAGQYSRAMQELSYSTMMLNFDDPRQVRYQETWGRIMYLAGDPRAAKPSYVDAIRASARLGVRGAKVADAYYGLARCLFAEGETRGGVGALRKALESCPSPVTRRAVESQLERLSGGDR